MARRQWTVNVVPPAASTHHRSTALTLIVSAVLFGLAGSLAFACSIAMVYAMVTQPLEADAMSHGLASDVYASRSEVAHSFGNKARALDKYGVLTDPFWGWRQYPFNQFVGFVKYGLTGSLAYACVIGVALARVRHSRDALELGPDEDRYDERTQTQMRIALFMLAPLCGAAATTALVWVRISPLPLPGGNNGYFNDFVGLFVANLATALLLAVLVTRVLAPRWQRRALRALQRCVRCGYPAISGRACSECGLK
jgi:uncharacterized membrane protein